MDRRTLMALLLSALVIVLTPMLFRGISGKRALPTRAAADTSTPAAPVAAPTPQPAVAPVTPPATGPAAAAAKTQSDARPFSMDTVGVAFGKTRFVFGVAGASPREIILNAYPNLGTNHVTQPKATLAASPAGGAAPKQPLLRYRLVRGADTVALDTIAFRPVQSSNAV